MSKMSLIPVFVLSKDPAEFIGESKVCSSVKAAKIYKQDVRPHGPVRRPPLSSSPETALRRRLSKDGSAR